MASKSIDVTGKTIDEAKNAALAQLGLSEDDVSIEILDRGKPKLFGLLGGSPAKIRVTYGLDELNDPDVTDGSNGLNGLNGLKGLKGLKDPDVTDAVKTEAPAPKTAPVERKPAPVRETRQPDPSPLLNQQSQPSEPRPAPVARPEPRPAYQPRKPYIRQERRDFAPVQQEELGELCNDEKAQKITAFLTGLLQHMQCQAQVQIKVYRPEEGRYKVIMEGERLGMLIGRRGETLDAIQQLTSYSINKSGEKRVRVHVDAENYRARREQSLQSLARKVAAKVVRNRRNVTLEPMNAYERHVIHTALQEIEGVTTYSMGTEPNRRVIVAVERGFREQKK